MNGDELAITFQDVTFSYPSKPSVCILKDLSFRIPTGSKIGFVGSTGCGKSTIAQLMLVFCRTTSGYISINGINMSDLDLHSLEVGSHM